MKINSKDIPTRIDVALAQKPPDGDGWYRTNAFNFQAIVPFYRPGEILMGFDELGEPQYVPDLPPSPSHFMGW